MPKLGTWQLTEHKDKTWVQGQNLGTTFDYRGRQIALTDKTLWQGFLDKIKVGPRFASLRFGKMIEVQLVQGEKCKEKNGPQIHVEIGALYNSSYSAQLVLEKMTKKN